MCQVYSYPWKGFMNKSELLNQAFALITLYISEFPPCICSEGYTSRNLVDPSCQHCDDIDVYNNMVAWQKSWYEEMGRLTPLAVDWATVLVCPKCRGDFATDHSMCINCGERPATKANRSTAPFGQGVLQMNIFEKIARRVTRRSWNKTVHHIMLEAEKRRIINSHQLHEILGAWNNECFPERGHASFLKAAEHRVQSDGLNQCANCGYLNISEICTHCGQLTRRR